MQNLSAKKIIYNLISNGIYIIKTCALQSTSIKVYPLMKYSKRRLAVMNSSCH